MSLPELLEKWKQTCERSMEEFDRSSALETIHAAEHFAQVFKALANHMAGVACPGCDGYGTKTYAGTTGWRGGIGGSMLTDSVCDLCWGTGRVDRKGPDLRALEAARQHHRTYADSIAAALKNVREYRESGEPAKSDREEIALLVGRAHAAQANARILAHSYQTGNNPPSSVVAASLEHPIATNEQLDDALRRITAGEPYTTAERLALCHQRGIQYCHLCPDTACSDYVSDD